MVPAFAALIVGVSTQRHRQNVHVRAHTKEEIITVTALLRYNIIMDELKSGASLGVNISDFPMEMMFQLNTMLYIKHVDLRNINSHTHTHTLNEFIM